MGPIPIEHQDKTRRDLMIAGHRLARLTSCNLKGRRLDSFGSLRAWPRRKTVHFLLPLTTTPIHGDECPLFTHWLSSQPLLIVGELQDLVVILGDLWCAVRRRHLVGFLKYRWRFLQGRSCPRAETYPET